jgi:hypothetical protein
MPTSSPFDDEKSCFPPSNEEGPSGEGGGEGDENLKLKRDKDTKHKQEGVQDKGKGMTVEKRKRPVSDAGGVSDTGGTVNKKECGEGVGTGGGDTEQKGCSAKCPHSRRRSVCKKCGGTSICENNHNRIRRGYK